MSIPWREVHLPSQFPQWLLVSGHPIRHLHEALKGWDIMYDASMTKTDAYLSKGSNSNPNDRRVRTLFTLQSQSHHCRMCSDAAEMFEHHGTVHISISLPQYLSHSARRLRKLKIDTEKGTEDHLIVSYARISRIWGLNDNFMQT